MPEPAWYEQQYNPRLSVPNFADFFQRWAQEAQQARQHLEYQTLPYGPGPKETLDLFPAPHSRALLVFIHGGYWRAFDKDDFSWIAPPLVRAGFSVAVINYALCPSVSIAEITEQCRRAVAWLYRAHPQPLIISGHSAGGHLTGEMFATPWADYGLPSRAIVGGISISGLFDLEPLIQVSFNSDLQLDAASARACSPAYKQPTVQAPLVLAVGALESNEFHRQSRLLKEAWPAICTEVIALPNCHHFNVLDALTDTNSPLWEPFLRL
ncbi:MAG: alpha/beta hydrolase [Meiothermus ruber]|uniref:alpha/beta hydrolase n=1 Tax=Meiothermus ruber TaxID=277 RepID=UPI0023FA3CAD|nr:alpha/beta hydrolase [Meiothermus ruber]MCL6530853.1 alpha/beta hydrolase [Meiothermus ruber]